MIHFSFALYAIVFILDRVFGVVGLQILSGASEITLKSDGDYTFMCLGYLPVKWHQNHYDPNFDTKKNSSINIKSYSLINNIYISLLSLSRASYLDTGNYVCDVLSEYMTSDDYYYYETLYLYFHHDAHLLAVPENEFKITLNEFDDVVLPCRPTSPDVNVILEKDDELLVPNYGYDGMGLEFDLKRGFLLYSVRMSSSGSYVCRAELNNRENIVTYELNVMPKIFLVQPYINNNNIRSDYATFGQNISLNCSVSMDIGIYFTLHWKVPDVKKLKTGLVQVDKENVFNGLKHGMSKSVGSRVLNIKNITVNDEGDYVCMVLMNSGYRIYKTFTLKALKTFLYITFQNHIYQIDRRKQTQVQWLFLVSANPTSNHVWQFNSSEEMEKVKSNKILMKNDKISSKLSTRDLELSDSKVPEQQSAFNDSYTDGRPTLDEINRCFVFIIYFVLVILIGILLVRYVTRLKRILVRIYFYLYTQFNVDAVI